MLWLFYVLFKKITIGRIDFKNIMIAYKNIIIGGIVFKNIIIGGILKMK